MLFTSVTSLTSVLLRSVNLLILMSCDWEVQHSNHFSISEVIFRRWSNNEFGSYKLSVFASSYSKLRNFYRNLGEIESLGSHIEC